MNAYNRYILYLLYKILVDTISLSGSLILCCFKEFQFKNEFMYEFEFKYEFEYEFKYEFKHEFEYEFRYEFEYEFKY